MNTRPSTSKPSSTPPPGLEEVWQRSRHVFLSRPEIHGQVERWLEQGGNLALVGRDGSGRSTELRRVAGILESRGAAWVRVPSTRVPWAGIDWALEDPALPGPSAPFPARHSVQRLAQAVACRLGARAPSGMYVLVDDLHHLDAASSLVVAELAHMAEVHLCVAGPEATPWADATCALSPMTPDDISTLVSRLLGTGSVPRSFGDNTVAASRGLPGPAVWLVIDAIRRGVLRREPDGWSVAGPDLRPADREAHPVWWSELFLSVDASRLGEIVALHEVPVARPALAAMTFGDDRRFRSALQELIDWNLVFRERDRIAWTSPAARKLLGEQAFDPVAAHRAIALDLLARDPVPHARLAVHLAGCRDPDLVRAHGPESLAVLQLRDPEGAARLGTRMWSVAPSSELVVATMYAHQRAGQPDKAIEMGEVAMRREAAEPVVLHPEATATLAGLLARLHLDKAGDPTKARGYVSLGQKVLGTTAPPMALVDAHARTLAGNGHPREAVSAARVALLRAPPAGALDQQAWLDLRLFVATTLAGLGDVGEALAVLSADPPGRGDPAREALDAHSARLLWQAGRYHDSARMFANAARSDTESCDIDQVRWMDQSGLALYQGGDRNGTLGAWSDALSLATRAGALKEKARIQANLGSVLREVCRFDEALQCGETAFRTATDLGSPTHASSAAIYLGDLHLSMEDWDGAATWFGRAAHIAERQDHGEVKVKLARRWAELAILRQDPGAVELVVEAIHAAHSLEMTREACRATILLAVALARNGHRFQVESTIEQAIGPLREAGASRTLAEVRLWAAEAYIAADRLEDAKDQAARVLAWAEEVGHLLYRNQADALIARANAAAPPPEDPSGMSRLLELAVALARKRDLRELLTAIAEAGLDLVQGDRSFVLLVEDGTPVVAAACARGDAPTGNPSMSLVRTAIARGREVIVSDLAERADLRELDSIMHLQLRSAMCVPMVDGTETIGAMYVDSRCTSGQELTEAARTMRALAAHAAVAVSNTRLLEERGVRADQAAEVAHDIRSPMASIILAADEILQSGEAPEWTHELLEAIVEQGNRVADMARRFLEKRSGQHRRIDLVERSEKIVMITSRDARRTGRSVVLDARGTAVVEGDVEQLDRAIQNLINNAVVHTPAGSRVVVGVREVGDKVVWSVRDNGTGVSEDIREHVFDRGFRGREDGPGHGLGLTIARRVAEAHGGSIRCDNHPDGGAIFEILLPLAPPEVP